MAKVLKKSGTKKKAPKVKKARKKTEETGSNLSNQQIHEIVRRAVDAHSEVERCKDKTKIANKGLAAILKDAKRAGIHPDSVRWYLNNKDRDPSEIDAETRERNTIARVEKFPIGTQLGLFEDGQTVAKKITTDGGHDRDDLKRVRSDGEVAGTTGKNQTSNPWPLNSPAFNAWDEGWIAGQTKIAIELGPKAA